MAWKAASRLRGAVLTGSFVLISAMGASALILEEGFESGAHPFVNSGNPPEVVTVPDARVGSYVMKSQLTPTSPDPERTEASCQSGNPNIWNFDVDEEYWVGISIKLDNDFDDGLSFNDQGMVMQWHYYDWRYEDGLQPQPLVVRFTGNDIRVESENAGVGNLVTGLPPAYGQWVDWVVHLKFSDTDGFFEVWRDGVKVVDWTGDNHLTARPDGAYLKFGLYSYQYDPNAGNHVPMPPGATRTVYHDEVRIDDANGSYASVAPGNMMATVILGNLSQTYDGTGKAASATTIPSGLMVDLTYDGLVAPPTNVGSYTVVGTINDATYQGSTTNTLVINQGTATVTLGDLLQTYDGTGKAASVSTIPSGLTVDVTYDGSAALPTNVGSYTVVGTINNANYQGSATNAMTIFPVAAPGTIAEWTFDSTTDPNLSTAPGGTYNMDNWALTTNANIANSQAAASELTWSQITADNGGFITFTAPLPTNQPLVLTLVAKDVFIQTGGELFGWRLGDVDSGSVVSPVVDADASGNLRLDFGPFDQILMTAAEMAGLSPFTLEITFDFTGGTGGNGLISYVKTGTGGTVSDSADYDFIAEGGLPLTKIRTLASGNTANYLTMDTFRLQTLAPVVPEPQLTHSVSGGAITFNWDDAGGPFTLQAQTNDLSTGLGTNWFPYSNGTNGVSVPINTGAPAVFFRLSN